MNEDPLRQHGVLVANGAEGEIHGAVLNSSVGVWSQTFVDATEVNWDTVRTSASRLGDSYCWQWGIRYAWVGWSPPPAPEPEPVSPDPPSTGCDDVLFICVRGSGEAPQDGNIPRTPPRIWALGSVGSMRVLDSMNRFLPGGEESPAVRGIGLIYPAADAVLPNIVTGCTATAFLRHGRAKHFG